MLEVCNTDYDEMQVCNGTFVSPKVLPCFHTFCQHCLERCQVIVIIVIVIIVIVINDICGTLCGLD